MSKYNDVYVKFKKIHCIYNKIYGTGYELKKVSNKPEGGLFDKLPVDYTAMLEFFDGIEIPLELDLGLEIGPVPFLGIPKFQELEQLNNEFLPEINILLEEWGDEEINVIGKTEKPTNKDWIKGKILFSISSGFYWYFDMNPPLGGNVGQIVFFYYMGDEAIVYVVAKNFVDFIELLCKTV